jgi:hypothetical protein
MQLDRPIHLLSKDTTMTKSVRIEDLIYVSTLFALIPALLFLSSVTNFHLIHVVRLRQQFVKRMIATWSMGLAVAIPFLLTIRAYGFGPVKAASFRWYHSGSMVGKVSPIMLYLALAAIPIAIVTTAVTKPRPVRAY